jgi:phosphate uptake regulator
MLSPIVKHAAKKFIFHFYMLYNTYNKGKPMERKLVKQGRNALTVTLPAKWLQTKGLKAGDSISLTQEDTLIISARGSAKTDVVIDLRDADRSAIMHVVMGKYIEGHDAIEILHSNQKAIQEVANKLIGMIIEEHSATRTVLKSVISVPEDNFKAIFRRAAHMFVQQARTLELMARGDATFEQLKGDEKLLDNHILYCMRYLNKYEQGRESYRRFLICATMEEAADQISRIGYVIRKNKQLAAIVVKGIEDYVRLLFSNDFKKIHTSLRSFRESIPRKTFADGLAFTLAEILYNYIGYIVEQK